MGLVLAVMARLALGHPHRQAAHGHCVAPAGFRLFWTWKSRHRSGRPAVSPDVRALIREMSIANPLWGAPRIHGELLKLGISASESTVAKYMRRRRRPPSQTWRTFLTNHASQIMAADLFVVPTVTFRLLFVLDEVSLRFIGRHLLSHRHDIGSLSSFTFRLLLIAQFSRFRLLGWRASDLLYISSRGPQLTMCYPLRVHGCGITPAASIKPCASRRRWKPS